jgi:hypothetical protein
MMHVLIAFLTAVAGLLWALNSLQRSAMKVPSFNPFAWHRKNKWLKKVHQPPLFCITSTKEAAAVLILGIAKLSGEITRELKQEIIEMFSTTFRSTESDSVDLYTLSSHYLREIDNIVPDVGKILQPSESFFSEEQYQTLLSLLEKVARTEGVPNNSQLSLIESVKNEFNKNGGQDTW